MFRLPILSSVQSGRLFRRRVNDFICGSESECLYGEPGRFTATRAREYTGIYDMQIFPAMASAPGVYDRGIGITSHTAGAEYMGRAEDIVGAELLEYFGYAGGL